MTARFTASVVGASGYAGGEAVRLLAGHPEFDLVQATSREHERRTVGSVHPNLRDLDLRFSDPADLASVDVLFAAVPHGVSMERIDHFRDAADLVVDLSSDFRLSDPEAYAEHYGDEHGDHERPELLETAVYGLPELHRADLPGAALVAAGGCNATAAILGLHPLVAAGLLDADDPLVVDLKVGSSEGGRGGGVASSHPERSGVVRPYAPAGHRHEAEVAQEVGVDARFTVHAVDVTRGAAATCHLFPDPVPDEGDLWAAYRERYDDEPFVRLVAGGSGPYRSPEPKAVAGTNVAEVGFAVDEAGGRVVVFSAIDNLVKGAAGQAVHAANVALGVEETAGFDFRGLHPVGAP